MAAALLLSCTACGGKEETKDVQPSVSQMKALLASARQRAMDLLEDYITNISNVVGKEYTIRWVYLDTNGEPQHTADTQTGPSGNT